jgi:hypothetical protein
MPYAHMIATVLQKYQNALGVQGEANAVCATENIFLVLYYSLFPIIKNRASKSHARRAVSGGKDELVDLCEM